MAYSRNEGVVVTGGSFNATNAAVGRGAQVHQTVGTDPQARDVQLKLDALLELLSQHRDQVPNSDEVTEATKSVKEELAKDKPNRLTLKSLLSGITDSVKSVGALAMAAEALKTAVVALIGL
jgi:hypothetical protein